MAEENKKNENLSQDEILESIRSSLTDGKHEEDEEYDDVVSIIRKQLHHEETEQTSEYAGVDNEEVILEEEVDKEQVDDEHEPIPEQNIFSSHKTKADDLLSMTVEELIRKVVEPIVKKCIDERLDELNKEE